MFLPKILNFLLREYNIQRSGIKKFFIEIILTKFDVKIFIKNFLLRKYDI